VRHRKGIGEDLSKWYICKGEFRWLVCAPVGLHFSGNGFFDTGREAIAAFARGGKA
jgi:hypothetical protein